VSLKRACVRARAPSSSRPPLTPTPTPQKTKTVRGGRRHREARAHLLPP
jgi:hypothetical protein